MTKYVKLTVEEAKEIQEVIVDSYAGARCSLQDDYRQYIESKIGILTYEIRQAEYYSVDDTNDDMEWPDDEDEPAYYPLSTVEEVSYAQYEAMLEDFADKLAGIEASIAELSTKWSERYHEACSYTYEPEQLTRIYVAIDTAYEMNDKAQIDKYNAELYNACVTKSLVSPMILFTSAEAKLLRKLVFLAVDSGAAPVGETWYQLQTVKRKLNVYLDGVLGDREYNEINSIEDGESDDQDY